MSHPNPTLSDRVTRHLKNEVYPNPTSQSGAQAMLVASGDTGVNFLSNATEEECRELRQYLAEIAANRFFLVLDNYATHLANSAQSRQPFIPIRCHPAAGDLLPLVPPDYTSHIWHTIDQVGRRIYGQFF